MLQEIEPLNCHMMSHFLVQQVRYRFDAELKLHKHKNFIAKNTNSPIMTTFIFVFTKQERISRLTQRKNVHGRMLYRPEKNVSMLHLNQACKFLNPQEGAMTAQQAATGSNLNFPMAFISMAILIPLLQILILIPPPVYSVEYVKRTQVSLLQSNFFA